LSQTRIAPRTRSTEGPGRATVSDGSAFGTGRPSGWSQAERLSVPWLQRTIGNQAVQRLARRSLLPPSAPVRFVQRQWTIDEAEMPKSAPDWVKKLQHLNTVNRTSHTFLQEGDLIHIDQHIASDDHRGLTIHFEKLAELTRGGHLEKVVAGSATAPDPSSELVKTGGLRLRFDNNLMQSVDRFITQSVPTSQHLKVRDFLTSSLTPHQDRARLFDIVNDNVPNELKQKGAAYAADHANDARLFANHYTFFISHSPDGKMPPNDVQADFEAKRKAATGLKFGPISLKPADTAIEAYSLVRAASAELSFESFEAVASHLEKHPLQERDTDRLDRYLAWARLVIAKGDAPGASRSQFDAGWDLAFGYFGHTLMVKLRPDGKAFISTFMTQASSYRLSESAAYTEQRPTVGAASVLNQTGLSQPIERVRLFIKQNLTDGGAQIRKQERQQPTGPDPAFVPGALFEWPRKGQPSTMITLILDAKPANDALAENGSTFTLTLNSTIKRDVNDRALFFLGLIEGLLAKQAPSVEERFERTRSLLDAATNLPEGNKERVEAIANFASFATTQLGIDPTVPPSFDAYQDFVMNQFAQLSININTCLKNVQAALPESHPSVKAVSNEMDKLQGELETLQAAVKAATDKKAAGNAVKAKKAEWEVKEKELRALTRPDASRDLRRYQDSASSVMNVFSTLMARLIKHRYEQRPRTGTPKGHVSGDLIYHLITPERASRATFAGVGISGGHLESNLKQFLLLYPEYHFVETKKASGLGTTLRLYKQYMWKAESTPPPTVQETARRPTLVNAMDADWLEAGVLKSTADDLIVWLERGMDALDAWAEFDPQGPASQRFGRGLYEGAPGERAVANDIEFSGRLEVSRELRGFVVTQLVPHVEWLKSL
jgi:hypothetical protein